LLAVAAALAAQQAPRARKPRLVLAIIIDQFRYDYLLHFRADYHAGLARMLDGGAVFTDAHYLHAYTVTAVGHATFLTGAAPSESGIVGNQWYDRQSGATVTSVSDPDTKTVGGDAGAAGSSPRRLLVSTVGDEVKMSMPGSKVIGVSIKDRAAILPSGHMADGAYWYDPHSNNWVTSTYYMADLPAWVKGLNDEKAYQRYANAEWREVDAREGIGTPFCVMGAVNPGAANVAGGAAGSNATRKCENLETTPFANEMTEEFAEQALLNENLGHHDGVDLLTVSFSANDYVGHAYGPDDPAIRDLCIRTDRLLGKLFDAVDQRVGAGNTLIVLASDHGVSPLPEVNQARRMPGGRLSEAGFKKAITDALARRFGPGDWLLPSDADMIYLNLKLAASLKLDPTEVERVAADAARAQDHIARVYTSQELRTGNVQRDDIGRAFSLAFYPSRSGNLLILPEPYYTFYAAIAFHGTPYDYDTHVPVMFLGPGIKPGVYAESIAPNDIAPTLAALLGVAQPSGSIGRVLRELMQ
jgi:predicted AlkP superfamily pyrophosphatase or phosphodiesterase